MHARELAATVGFGGCKTDVDRVNGVHTLSSLILFRYSRLTLSCNNEISDVVHACHP